MKRLGLVLSLCLAAGTAWAASPKPQPQVDVAALMRKTGVYHLAPGASTPRFVSDPAWPQPLPHNWLMGQVGGLYVDSHDHVWIYNRTRTLTNDEAGLEGPATGAKVSGLGGDRANGPVADCCRAAPGVMEFDAAGKLLRAWGGPADPGFLKTKCREDQGCIWPNTEHGIYVDAHDNVWLAGNSAAVPTTGAPWITNTHGGDGFVLKFDRDGNFKMRIGGTPTGPDSNAAKGGAGDTPVMFLPADMTVDEAAHQLYVADGYGNRRVLIVDSETGRYIGHFGAYGNNPVDDKAAAAAGRWNTQYKDGQAARPAFFRNPVHCVKFTGDGKLYVCDRGNDRFQVFDLKNPNLGKPCDNPSGAAGKCGFLAEQVVSGHTEAMPVTPGTTTSVNFSTDKAQTCLYVGDNANQTIYILDRRTLKELGRLGSSGRDLGQFHWLHQVGVDSHGNLYTGEVDTGKRIQRFIRFGPSGCSGAGFGTVGGVVER
jgi:DNA-binding beta-propeller fold protein YncE